MVELIEIISSSRYSHKWPSLKRGRHPHVAFLYPFSPAFNYIYQQLWQTIVDAKIIVGMINKPLLRCFLKHDLGQQLLPLIERCLALELHSASQRGWLQASTPQARFDEFITKLSKRANMVALLGKYQQLTTTIAIMLDNYLQFNQTFFNRLQHDWQRQLTQLMPTHQSLSLRQLITTGDRHCQGRRIIIVVFSTKDNKTVKVVYKPRPLQLDCAFQQFIAWFNSRCFNINLYQQTIMDCGDYGWCQYIDHMACDTKWQLHRFYQRCGALMMILYLLGGSDIHWENIIAYRDHPVIIDLECLLKPLIARGWGGQTHRNTVMESLFLPYKQLVSENYEGIDLSAINAKGEQLLPYKAMVWRASGSDKMRITRQSLPIPSSYNQPKIIGSNVNPLDYSADLVLGFETAYNIILSHKAWLLSQASPLQAFKKAQVRVLFRSTSDYSKLLIESYHPKLWYYPQKRRQHFAWLQKITTVFPAYQHLLSAELFDLNQGDIPYFYTIGDEKTLKNSDGVSIKLPFIYSGWQLLQQRLKQTLGRDDLTLQKRIITNSYVAAVMNQSVTTAKPYQWVDNVNLAVKSKQRHLPCYSLKTLRQQSLQDATCLLAHLDAIKVSNKTTIYWPTIELTKDIAWNPTATGVDLYSGIAGIALSFAYGAVVFNSSHYQKLAWQCYQMIASEYQLQQQLPLEYRASTFVALGAYHGIGGILLTLYRLYQLWQHQEIKVMINQLVISASTLITCDQALDVIGGVAGLLLVLSTIYPLLDQTIYQPLATACVDHLLQLYPHPGQLSASSQLSKPLQPLLGFSHGVAGICLALAKYQQQFPHHRKVQHWIKESLAYERSHYCEKKRNWPDFRSGNAAKNHYMVAWCHGASGIGLSRVALGRLLSDSYCHKELALALKTTMKSFDNDSNISLCHGHLGNLELLWQVRCHYPKLLCEQSFINCYHKTLQQLKEHHYHDNLQGQGGIVGLMMGVSGVIYQLLRLARPSQVPSILLIE